MVSISGCDPLDPGSNPGTAKCFCCWVFVLDFKVHFVCVCVLVNVVGGAGRGAYRPYTV